MIESDKVMSVSWLQRFSKLFSHKKSRSFSLALHEDERDLLSPNLNLLAGRSADARSDSWKDELLGIEEGEGREWVSGAEGREKIN